MTQALAPVRRALALALAMLKLQGRGVLYLSGLSVEQLLPPARNPETPLVLDVVRRAILFVLRLFRAAFYPEILFRNVMLAVVLQMVYEGGGWCWKKLRRRLATLTASGKRSVQHLTDMENAKSYMHFRAAEKAFLAELGHHRLALNAEERAICAQLEGRISRYRRFIRDNDVHRLQFELRSDLLRKHFGHDKFHPSVRESIQRYVGIVCAAFGLLASGSVPAPLRALVYEDDGDGPGADVTESLDHFEEGQNRDLSRSNSLIEMTQAEDDDAVGMESRPSDADTDEEGEEQDAASDAGGSGGGSPASAGEKVGSGADSNAGSRGAQRRMSHCPHLGNTLEEKLSLARSRLDFFVETRHSFGRTALLLSGGARMGLYHVGVAKTLMDHNLLPRVISGSSAGSIIAAVLACKTEEEIRTQLFDPEKMNLRFFGRSDSIDVGLQSMLKGETPPESVKESLLAAFLGDDDGSRRGQSLMGLLLMLLPPPFPSYIMILRKLLPRWIESKVLLDIDILKTAIRNVIGDMTFQEAYDRTGRIVNITATPHGGDRDVPNLLNYLSAPYVTVWSAACASCCIPGVFAPVTLMAKGMNGELEPYNPAGLRWIDGSLEADLPMQRLGELFNINHFVVSQVNPHAQILAPHDGSELEYLPRFERRVLETVGCAVRFCRDQGRSYLKHLTNFGLNSALMMPFSTNGLVPVLVQKYSGDITIYPKMKPNDLVKLLQNPTNEEYEECILDGERMTWPKLQQIRRRCMVEFMLDDCVHAMQEHIKTLQRKARRSSQLFPRSMQLSPPEQQFGQGRISRVASYTVFSGANSAHTHEPTVPGIGSEHQSPGSASARSRVFSDDEDGVDHGLFPIGAIHEGESQSSRMQAPPSQLESRLMGRIQSVNQLSSLGDEEQSPAPRPLSPALEGEEALESEDGFSS